MRSRLRETIGLVRLVAWESVRSFGGNGGLETAAVLAFQGVLALLPLLLLLLIATSRIMLSSGPAVAELERAIAAAFPQFSPAILGDIHKLSEQHMWGAFSLMALFWSVTPFAAAVRGAFARIFKPEQTPRFLRAKLLDAGALLLALVVVVLFIGIRMTFGAAERILLRHPAAAHFAPGLAAPILVTAPVIAFLYRIFTPVRVQTSALVAGSITATALLLAIRPLFAWVLQFNPSYGYTFGSMKAAFLMMVWVYYLFAAVLLGAEVMANTNRREALLLRALFASPHAPAAVGPLLQRLVSEFGRDTVLFREGDAGYRMYYVLSGAVALTRRGELLRVMRPGDYFGEMSMLIGTPRTAAATVTEPATRLVAVSQENLGVLLRENPAIVRTLLVEMARRLKSTNELIETVQEPA